MSGESKETCFDEFVAAREQFEKLMGELRSDSARILEHGEVESLIAREGNELLRRLMQGYLDQRTAAEERCEVVTGADGADRRHCRARSRSLATVFGGVTVRRLGYSGARLKSVFPLDAGGGHWGQVLQSSMSAANGSVRTTATHSVASFHRALPLRPPKGNCVGACLSRFLFRRWPDRRHRPRHRPTSPGH